MRLLLAGVLQGSNGGPKPAKTPHNYDPHVTSEMLSVADTITAACSVVYQLQETTSSAERVCAMCAHQMWNG